MTIYLDNMAATPIDPRVAEQHHACMLTHAGNPHSSEHAAGVEAMRAIDDAAEKLLDALGSPAEHVTFTPGASAALWLGIEDAVMRISGRPAVIAASTAEHPALLSALRRAQASGRIELVPIPVDHTAAPRLDALEKALARGVDLVCTIAASNEVGTITDLAVLGPLIAAAGARHLVDASQAAGRIDLGDAAQADLLVVSGAKAYGPRRAGALIGELSRQAGDMAHDVFGSPDAPSAVALAYAMKIRAAERSGDEHRIAGMRDELEAKLCDAIPGLLVNGDPDRRLAGCLHISTPHLPGEAAVGQLWGRLAVSTGAACQSGVPGPSHVLSAMGLPDWASEGALRIGIGRFNTQDELDAAAELLATVLSPVARKFA